MTTILIIAAVCLAIGVVGAGIVLLMVLLE